MPQLEAGFYQQKLFEQSFVCMVSRDHPRITSELTLSRFVDEAHIIATTSGTGHQIVDKVLGPWEYLAAWRGVPVVCRMNRVDIRHRSSVAGT